jgi:hypothetical protein
MPGTSALQYPATQRRATVLALRAMNIYFRNMRPSRWRLFAFGLVLVFCASGGEQASARSKKHRLDPPSLLGIATDASGTPIIMQGLERANGVSHDQHHSKKSAERRTVIPRGSASYVPPIFSAGGLPRTPLLGAPPPAVVPYNPPPINSPSDRVIQSNQSFQFNRGLGNNPTDRDAYIRYQLGR